MESAARDYRQLNAANTSPCGRFQWVAGCRFAAEFGRALQFVQPEIILRQTRSAPAKAAKAPLAGGFRLKAATDCPSPSRLRCAAPAPANRPVPSSGIACSARAARL